MNVLPFRSIFKDLLANIRLGWKGLPGTNTLTYLATFSVPKKKSFIIDRSKFNVIKLF